MRSSERMYRWLVEHERLGCYVRDFLSGKGIPRKAKRAAIVTMWLTSQLSWVIIIAHAGVGTLTVAYAGLLVVVAILVHWHIGYRVPTREDVCEAA